MLDWKIYQLRARVIARWTSVDGWMDEMDGLRDGWLVGCLFDGTNEWLQASVECTYANIKHSASEQSEWVYGDEETFARQTTEQADRPTKCGYVAAVLIIRLIVRLLWFFTINMQMQVRSSLRGESVSEWDRRRRRIRRRNSWAGTEWCEFTHLSLCTYEFEPTKLGRSVGQLDWWCLVLNVYCFKLMNGTSYLHTYICIPNPPHGLPACWLCISVVIIRV